MEKINLITSKILKASTDELKAGTNRTSHVYLDVQTGQRIVKPMDKTVAEKIQVGDSIVAYAEHENDETDNDAIKVYKVIDKIIDYKGNVFIITDYSTNIEVEVEVEVDVEVE